MSGRLTDKQERVLKAARRLAERGKIVSHRRLSRESGLTAGAVSACLRALVRKGLVSIEEAGEQRRYRIGELVTPWVSCAPPTRRKRKDCACTPRACLCCGKPFMSEGPHNRLCAQCRKNGDGGLPCHSVTIGVGE